MLTSSAFDPWLTLPTPKPFPAKPIPKPIPTPIPKPIPTSRNPQQTNQGTMTWEAMRHGNTGITYDAWLAHCAARNQDLCDFEEVCPGGAPSDPYGEWYGYLVNSQFPNSIMPSKVTETYPVVTQTQLDNCVASFGISELECKQHASWFDRNCDQYPNNPSGSIDNWLATNTVYPLFAPCCGTSAPGTFHLKRGPPRSAGRSALRIHHLVYSSSEFSGEQS